jgi:hypothetical protein
MHAKLRDNGGLKLLSPPHLIPQFYCLDLALGVVNRSLSFTYALHCHSHVSREKKTDLNQCSRDRDDQSEEVNVGYLPAFHRCNHIDCSIVLKVVQ